MTFFCARLILALCPPCSCSAPALFLLCACLVFALCPPCSCYAPALFLLCVHLILILRPPCLISHCRCIMFPPSNNGGIFFSPHHPTPPCQREQAEGEGKRVRNYRILTQVIQAEVSTGLRKRVRKIQREGQKEWDIDTRREVDEDEVDDGDCGRWMLQNVSNMDESVRGT